MMVRRGSDGQDMDLVLDRVGAGVDAAVSAVNADPVTGGDGRCVNDRAVSGLGDPQASAADHAGLAQSGGDH